VGSVVIVEVQPRRQRISPGGLGVVEAGVGPAIGERAEEAFDLAVGLRPVGAGALVRDAQRGAGIAPGVGLVGRAVVGQDAFDGDPAFGEPGDRALEDGDGGDRLLIGANSA
jgi:hypothetical protein